MPDLARFMHVDSELASSKAPQRGGNVEFLELDQTLEGERMKREREDEHEEIARGRRGRKCHALPGQRRRLF